MSVEFLFEQVGATFGIADIFSGVAARTELDGDRTALEGGAQILHALPVGVVETFGDAQVRGEAADGALVVVVEDRVRRMVSIWGGLAVVVADDGGNDTSIAPIQTRNVPIKGEVLAVLVMAAMADTVTDVVEKGAGFELHPGLRRQVMERLEMIE